MRRLRRLATSAGHTVIEPERSSQLSLRSPTASAATRTRLPVGAQRSNGAADVPTVERTSCASVSVIHAPLRSTSTEPSTGPFRVTSVPSRVTAASSTWPGSKRSAPCRRATCVIDPFQRACSTPAPALFPGRPRSVTCPTRASSTQRMSAGSVLRASLLVLAVDAPAMRATRACATTMTTSATGARVPGRQATQAATAARITAARLANRAADSTPKDVVSFSNAESAGESALRPA